LSIRIYGRLELFAGKTLADVGSRFDGDLLGRDPSGAWGGHGKALAAVQADGPMRRKLHVSWGQI